MMILNKKNRLFLLIVMLPTLVAIFYYGLIAADVYISESRFVVRSPERQTASPLGHPITHIIPLMPNSHPEEQKSRNG